MKNMGDIVEKKVRASGYPITRLAKLLRFSRNNVYKIFERTIVDDDIVLAIGKHIGYDFTEDFPHLKEIHPEMLQEPTATYGTVKDLDKCKAQKEMIWEKYTALLEENNALQKAYNELLRVSKSS